MTLLVWKKDLKKLKQVERIVYDKEVILEVEGLTKLKEIGYMNDMKCYDIKEIPNSVTKINLLTDQFKEEKLNIMKK